MTAQLPQTLSQKISSNVMDFEEHLTTLRGLAALLTVAICNEEQSDILAKQAAGICTLIDQQVDNIASVYEGFAEVWRDWKIDAASAVQRGREDSPAVKKAVRYVERDRALGTNGGVSGIGHVVGNGNTVTNHVSVCDRTAEDDEGERESNAASSADAIAESLNVDRADVEKVINELRKPSPSRKGNVEPISKAAI